MSEDELRPRIPIPFADYIGMKWRVIESDRIVAAVEVKQELCNPMGSMHGGAVTSIADTLGTVGGFRNLPEGAKMSVTLECKTNFVGAAKTGETVVGECTPVHIGKRTSVWTTQIKTESGDLVAVVTQTQMAL